MAEWSEEELSKIAEADDLHIRLTATMASRTALRNGSGPWS